MKKLLLSISILFLTLSLYAQEFEYPFLMLEFRIMRSEMAKKYKVLYEDEDYISYDTKSLFYQNRPVKDLLLKKPVADEAYTIIITFQEMTDKEWINTIMEIMYKEKLVIMPNKLSGEFVYRKQFNDGPYLEAVYMFKQTDQGNTFVLIKLN